MMAKLWASRLKNNKGKAKPSTSKATTFVGDDVSYLPLTTIVLGATLCNVPLKTDTRVRLEPMGFPRHQALTRLRLRDEDEKEAEGGEGETLGS